jgi:hypothetical protein
MFQSIRVALGPSLDLPVSIVWIDAHAFGKQLKVNIVAIFSAIQSKK